ncbi:hypothetical protein [Rhodopirellula bahusiensis]|uniref:hypothetical protein n=1 Tax=Rhodopirellula bahusiensis TaxID=2014065 RepID=UPI0013041410|nr:hypothetical protein [Rhodopirellula bahusiensis]
MLVVRIRRAKSGNMVRHMLSLHRLYKNGDLWHESTRFGQDDIPFVRFLLDGAHTWMIQQEDGSAAETEGVK